MRTSYQTTKVHTTHPSVHLTKRRNRMKIYSGNSVYMKNKDEFELEFDNTTSDTWLAKIAINNEIVSDSGLVLRPGERVFLDTPNLNDSIKNKFQFNTYNVESGRSHLTSDNGRITIYFYKKEIFHNNYIDWNKIPPWSDKYPPDTHTNPVITYRNNFTEDNTGNFNPMITTNVSDGGTRQILCNSVKMEETGRIEGGSKSDSEFFTINEKFESFHSHTVEYRILPISKKPTTIQEVKQYCSQCGRRKRKNDNFCPADGTKF